jgi:hypothetical protein
METFIAILVLIIGPAIALCCLELESVDDVSV